MLASSSVSSSMCVIILDNNTESVTSVLSDCIDSKSIVTQLEKIVN